MPAAEPVELPAPTMLLLLDRVGDGGIAVVALAILKWRGEKAKGGKF